MTFPQVPMTLSLTLTTPLSQEAQEMAKQATLQDSQFTQDLTAYPQILDLILSFSSTPALVRSMRVSSSLYRAAIPYLHAYHQLDLHTHSDDKPPLLRAIRGSPERTNPHGLPDPLFQTRIIDATINIPRWDMHAPPRHFKFPNIQVLRLAPPSLLRFPPHNTGNNHFDPSPRHLVLKGPLRPNDVEVDCDPLMSSSTCAGLEKLSIVMYGYLKQESDPWCTSCVKMPTTVLDSTLIWLPIFRPDRNTGRNMLDDRSRILIQRIANWIEHMPSTTTIVGAEYLVKQLETIRRNPQGNAQGQVHVGVSIHDELNVNFDNWEPYCDLPQGRRHEIRKRAGRDSEYRMVSLEEYLGTKEAEEVFSEEERTGWLVWAKDNPPEVLSGDWNGRGWGECASLVGR